jgi:putative transposase
MKIHALVDDRCAAVMLRLTAGQAQDNPQLAPLLAAYTAAHGRRFRLLADKGYAHDSTRIHLRQQRISHMIPERSDQIARRKARGSRGGRPPAFDAMTYRHRNTVERSFNRAQTLARRGHPGMKNPLSYLGGVILAAAITAHRVQLAATA